MNKPKYPGASVRISTAHFEALRDYAKRDKRTIKVTLERFIDEGLAERSKKP